MATLANLAVIVFEVIGLSISIGGRGWKVLAYYTQVSNLVTFASAVGFLLLGAAVAPLRYLSSCMLVMTFLVTLCILVPMGGGFRRLMLEGNGLYHHTICPLLSVASYVLLEPHATHWVLPVVVTAVYGLTMLQMNWARRFDGPYPFFRVHKQSLAASVLWTVALLAAIGVIAWAMGVVAR